jgi:3-oxoacyl-[acyl-carrier-protein] synthase III
MSALLGLGHYVPSGVLSNEALAAEFNVTQEWILSVCGIETRRTVSADETVCDLAERAALACLQDARITADKLGAIIACTGTPHRQFPGVSSEVQKRLKAGVIPAFDIHLASISGLFGLALAHRMCEQWGPVLVVAAETMTRVMGQQPRVKETAILFGDGAGACVVAPSDAPLALRDVQVASDATFSEALRLDFGSSLQMDGRTIIMHAVRKLARATTEMLEKNSLRVEDVGLFLFHQANLRLLERLMQELKIDRNRCFLNVRRYGNTSSASWLIAASEAKAAGLLRPGMKVVVAAFGAGLSWGAALLETCKT